jgi:hypothetical protein
MRRALILLLFVILFGLLWMPISARSGGLLGGTGWRVTRYGALGVVVVTTELSWYDLGDLPVSRSVEFSWGMFSLSVAITIIGGWLTARVWRRAGDFNDSGTVKSNQGL